MELTHLRYFATVARTLHFRRAAAMLNMTQAPLSAAIRKLEEELGTELFKRTSRSVELTAAGNFFLPEAEAVLNRAEQSQQRLQDFLNKQSETLFIGYNEPAIHSFMPAMLSALRLKQPSLQLQMRELETAEQWELLKSGKLDMGFMRPLYTDMEKFSTLLVLREKYLLAMPESHPLARKERISGKDLENQEIILFARDVNPPAYDHLSTILSVECGQMPRFRQDCRNKNSMLALVQADFGIALLPESCCRGLDKHIVTKPVDIPLPPVDIMAVWDPANTTHTIKNLLEILQQIKNIQID